MKSVVFVLIWSILFTSFGIYTNDRVYQFTDKYNNNISKIEECIKNNNWEEAEDKLKSFSDSYHKEKGTWYKLLDHTYFDDLCLYLNILDESIYTKNKTNSLEEIERIKSTLENILECSKFDINHIL